VLLVVGASALAVDRRKALRVAAVAVACPSRPPNACAVLACVDGKGVWCGGLPPATNDRALSAETVKAAYEAELAALRPRPPPPDPSEGTAAAPKP
jgi:hypothetical protein